MPPKKRALQDADANAGRASKRSSSGSTRSDKGEQENKSDEQHEHEHNHDDNAKEGTPEGHDHRDLDPFTYICVPRPSWDDPHDAEADSEDDDDDDDDKSSDRSKPNDSSMFKKSPSEHPDWKWVMMWESWKNFCEYNNRADYTHPDLFHMYIYNDFHAYGLQELIENMLATFDKELKKHKNGTCDDHLRLLWAAMASLAHWLQHGDNDMWMTSDDGDQTCNIVGAIGSAFLTALDAIDKTGELKKDSTFLDLSLVMSIYLEFARGLEDYGIDDEKLQWRPHVVAYAKKGGLDLKARGCFAVSKSLQKYGQTKLGGAKKTDKWDWSKNLKALKQGRKQIGGTKYDITRMSRRERAEHAFDKVDPLAQFSDKDLREGNLMLT